MLRTRSPSPVTLPTRTRCGKRITAIAIEGDRLVLLDNLEGKFGNGTIDRLLTATTWKDRVLGENRQIEMPLWATWFATGNNVRIQADTTRRVCHIRLESPLEKPEDRTDLRRPDLLVWVTTERPKLLGAALTILAAYTRGGRPSVPLGSLGKRRGVWSALVRAAILWIGLPDPARTRSLLQDSADVEAGAAAALVTGWRVLDPDRYGLTAGKVLSRLSADPIESSLVDLREAVETLLPRMDGRLLGVKLRDLRRRRFGGAFLDIVAKAGGANRWTWFLAGENSGYKTESADEENSKSHNYENGQPEPCVETSDPINGESSGHGEGSGYPPAGRERDDAPESYPERGYGTDGGHPPTESDSRGIWWLDPKGMAHRLVPGSSPNEIPATATYLRYDGEEWRKAGE